MIFEDTLENENVALDGVDDEVLVARYGRWKKFVVITGDGETAPLQLGGSPTTFSVASSVVPVR